MKIRSLLLLALGMGVFCGAPGVLAQEPTDAVERLGSGTISVEAKQKGPTLILNLESDLKDVASLSVSTPAEPVELLRISVQGHDIEAPAKASVLSSAPTVEGAFKTAIVYDLSQARELVVTVRLLDGTSQDFHWRGSVVNDKVEIKLSGSHCTEWTLNCSGPNPCMTKATCCGVQAPCLDCRTCTINCPPCEIQAASPQGCATVPAR